MKKLSPEEEVLFISSIAVKIAKELNNDELLIAGDAFSLLGQALVTIYDRRDIQSNNTANSDKSDTAGKEQSGSSSHVVKSNEDQSGSNNKGKDND